MNRTALILVLVAGVLCGEAQALTVTLENASLMSRAGVGTGTQVIEEHNPNSAPFTQTVTASMGQSTSISTFTISDTLIEMLIVEHSRASSAGGQPAFADTTMNINFSVDQDVRYVLSGRYDALGGDSDKMDQLGEVRLAQGASETLFRNLQRTTDSSVASFVLGEEEGDAVNYLTGSLTGTLTAGTTYFFGASAFTQGFPPTESGSATGYVRLQLIPEPATGIMLAFGLVALGIRKNR